MKLAVYLHGDGASFSEPELVGRYGFERAARKAAAAALGRQNLRGLAQAQTPDGSMYYAPGADDEYGASVEIADEGGREQ